MTRPIVIYHGGHCPDGFGSAYAAWRHFELDRKQAADYVAANHGEPPPDCRGRTVYILDFSYRRALMAELCRQAERVVILDHHISAQKDLEGLDQEYDNLELNFDMSRSGAVITWEYFHAAPVPQLLAVIQDQDLWRFQIPDTRHIMASLISYPLEFELWHRLACDDTELSRLAQEGRAINRYRQYMVNVYRGKAVMGRIDGHEVPVVNCPLAIMSELVGELAQNHPFAAGYTDQGNRRTWSLRSTAEGLNVAEIAARFGGGGHSRAAGFSTEIPSSLLILDP